MGREIRRVPKKWQHPKRPGTDRHKPLRVGFADAVAEYRAKVESDGREAADDYFGGEPNGEDYMPEWPEAERTHLMLYETCSEGTPISPAFATPEELARWLTDNNASSFGSMTATYEQWLGVCRSGWAPSGVYTPRTGLISGVAAITEIPPESKP